MFDVKNGRTVSTQLTDQPFSSSQIKRAVKHLSLDQISNRNDYNQSECHTATNILMTLVKELASRHVHC